MKKHTITAQQAMTALHRAAALARKTAIETNTCLVIMEKGQLRRIPAGQLLCEPALSPPPLQPDERGK